jgi:hypothetical protein
LPFRLSLALAATFGVAALAACPLAVAVVAAGAAAAVVAAGLAAVAAGAVVATGAAGGADVGDWAGVDVHPLASTTNAVASENAGPKMVLT